MGILETHDPNILAQANAPFSNALKTSKNLWFPDIFGRGRLLWNSVIMKNQNKNYTSNLQT